MSNASNSRKIMIEMILDLCELSTEFDNNRKNCNKFTINENLSQRDLIKKYKSTLLNVIKHINSNILQNMHASLNRNEASDSDDNNGELFENNNNNDINVNINNNDCDSWYNLEIFLTTVKQTTIMGYVLCV